MSINTYERQTEWTHKRGGEDIISERKREPKVSAYLLLDGCQDVVGRGAVGLHAAAAQTLADGQQVAVLRGCALLRGWHSSCMDAHTAAAVISTSDT